MTVQLFIPCYIDQFSPHVAQSFCNFLDKLNISWNYPTAQTCCGQFAFNAGDWQSARRMMRHFFRVFNPLEPIICPSASCVLTIRRHYPLLVETSTDAANLTRLQPLVFEFTEWLSRLLPLPFPLIWPGKIFLHNSCSAKQLNILPSLKYLLGFIQHLQITEVSQDHSCCGFGGLFSFKCPDLALAIGSTYLQSMLRSNAIALVSSDVGCLLHLQRITDAIKISLPMYHLVELIYQSSQDF
jgi:L-lactate dehydrogenase complex protein LldE